MRNEPYALLNDVDLIIHQCYMYGSKCFESRRESLWIFGLCVPVPLVAVLTLALAVKNKTILSARSPGITCEQHEEVGRRIHEVMIHYSI